jgi:hypothetical protein
MSLDVQKLLKCKHRGAHYELRWEWALSGQKYGYVHSYTKEEEPYLHRIIKDLRRDGKVAIESPTQKYVICHECGLHQLVEIIDL